VRRSVAAIANLSSTASRFAEDADEIALRQYVALRGVEHLVATGISFQV
jgi:hypothetical protein